MQSAWQSFFVPILMLVDFHKNWHTNISISLKNNKIYLQVHYIVVRFVQISMAYYNWNVYRARQQGVCCTALGGFALHK